MIYISGVQEPNDHNVLHSFTEYIGVFFKWMFFDQL